jgi:hypothetical protein
MKHMQLRSHFLSLVVVGIVMVTMSGRTLAQPATDPDAMLEVVRADLRADKVAIVTAAMNFKAGEADKFWPVYRQYEAEVIKLNDDRIRMIRDYAKKFDSITDADAKMMAEQFFDWESRRTRLRKDYLSQFAKATSWVSAAKFFQVEHRLDLLVDLKLASELPGLWEKSTGNPK